MMSKQVQRYDYTRLDRVEKTPEGFVVAPMRATRTGVFVYTGPDGKPFYELRPPEEVFDEESRKSLAMKPITNGHPFELVTSKNSHKFQVGSVGENIEVEENRFLSVMAALTDDSVIADVDKGKVEVSCGYTNELDMTPGWWDDSKQEINQEGRGEKFDAIQRNIRYNHVAVVTRGRAGNEVRLRLDEGLNIIQEAKSMKMTIDGIEYEVDAPLVPVIQNFQRQLKQTNDSQDGLNTRITELEKENTDLKADGDKKQARVDELEVEVKESNDSAKFNQRVKERTHLVSTAAAVMRVDGEDKTEELETMDDLEIMKAAIKSAYPDLKLDEKSKDYIQARFDSLAEKTNEDKSDEAGEKFGGALENGRQKRGDELKAGDQAKAIVMRADEIKHRFSADQIAKGEHKIQARKELGFD
jgi:hypothetical protein